MFLASSASSGSATGRPFQALRQQLLKAPVGVRRHKVTEIEVEYSTLATL